MEGKVETMAIEQKGSDSSSSSSSDISDSSDSSADEDLINELAGILLDTPAKPLEEVGELLSLKDMYKKTFEEASVQKEDLQQLNYNQLSLANAMIKYRKQARKKVSELRGHTSGEDKEKDKKDKINDQKQVYDYIRLNIQNHLNDTLILSANLNSMIEHDYMNSDLNAAAYKKKFESLDYEAKAVELVVSKITKKVTKKMVVDPGKKNKLLRIIHMAIQIGLNYQMLEPFRFKFPPPTLEISSKEYSDLFAGQKVTDEMVDESKDKMKKVALGDLEKHPYWENIRVFPDLTGFVSLHALKTLKTDQLINTVKRTTLYRVYNVSRNYRLNLDEASVPDLQQLCNLNTLKLAQKVREAASRYFNGKRDDENLQHMKEMYSKWLNSTESFKMYTKPVENDFFNIPKLSFKSEASANEVINDLSLLPGLFWYTKDEDPESESVKNGPLERSDAPADTKFAIELSRKFVEMGILPVGYERYCGVKAGKAKKKRSADGRESPAKRQREKLFTPIEIH